MPLVNTPASTQYNESTHDDFRHVNALAMGCTSLFTNIASVPFTTLTDFYIASSTPNATSDYPNLSTHNFTTAQPRVRLFRCGWTATRTTMVLTSSEGFAS